MTPACLAGVFLISDQSNAAMGTLKLSHYKIHLSRYGLNADRPFCVAVLADLHNRAYGTDIGRVADAVRKNGCDLVLSAGDLVVMKAGRFATDKALELVGMLAADYPVYTANGNHETRMKRLFPEEYSRYTQELAALGAVNLVNESKKILIHSVPFNIAGLELERDYYHGPVRMTLDPQSVADRVGAMREDSFNILLAHHPRYFDAYAGWGADLALAGHLHGGIVRLPLVGGVISPDPCLFPHYDHGRYTKGRSTMIVSAGLGTHTINLRFNNPAELVLVDFE